MFLTERSLELTKYKLSFRKGKPTLNYLLEYYDSKERIEFIIKHYNLGKYEPEITEVNDLDNSRLEEYPNVKKSELYPKGSDMYKYYTHQEMIEDFNKNFNKELKDTQTYDLTDDGTGKKYDTGKPMVGTLCRVFPRALMAIGSCIEFGTHKYPKPDNWKKVEGAYTRYQDSMVRHYLKHLQDIEKDEETGKLHLAHLCWNALAITELYLIEHPELMEELNG